MSQELPYLNQPKNTRRFASLTSIPRRLLRFLLPSDSSFSRQWVNQVEEVSQYWAVYGGFRALLQSPYLHISAILTVITWGFRASNHSASEIAVGVLPNLLGFTVGALAIVLAFSSAAVFATLAERGAPQSFFMRLTGSLIHFIMIQVLALVSAIIARMTDKTFMDFVSLFLLFYAVIVTFAAGLQLFLTAVIYNAKASIDAKKKSTDVSG
jgi:hypothetical protein